MGTGTQRREGCAILYARPAPWRVAAFAFTLCCAAHVAAGGAIAAPAVAAGNTSYSTCWVGDSDCPPCPAGHTESFDTIIWLGLGSTGQVGQFRAAMEKAQGVFRGAPGVNNYDPWEIYHTTINYFCCHTASEKATIKQVIKDLEWAPFNLTFGKAQCNAGPGTYASPGGGAACGDALTLSALCRKGEDHLSVYALADEPTQSTLWAFATRIQDVVEAAGIPINHPRQQAFHCTMGQTKLTYPANSIVGQINASFPVYNPTQPVTVTWFLNDWDPVHANGTDVQAGSVAAQAVSRLRTRSLRQHTPARR